MTDSADGLAFDLGSAILSEYLDDDFPSIQIDLYGGDSCPSIELHGPYGLYYRPLDADKDDNGNVTAACKAMFAHEGDRLHAWLLEDARVTALLPKLLPGESLFYGPTSNFVRNHADGRVSMYTTDDGTPNGHTILRGVDPDPIFGGIVDFSPWGKVTLNSLGYHVFTNGGGQLDLGGCGIPGAGAVGVESYAWLTADSVALKGKAVSLGEGTDNIVLSTPLIAILGELVTTLQAIGAALLVPAATGKPADSGDAKAAIAAFAGAMTAALVAMKSASTMSS